MRKHILENRDQAAFVLGFFRSPEIIELLKSLLHDPQVEHSAQGQLDYSVRAVAYGVLAKWGVDVRKPIVRVKIQEPWNGKVPPD
jgi:hypothetical protein